MPRRIHFARLKHAARPCFTGCVAGGLGSALERHARGRRFDPAYLRHHKERVSESLTSSEVRLLPYAAMSTISGLAVPYLSGHETLPSYWKLSSVTTACPPSQAVCAPAFVAGERSQLPISCPCCFSYVPSNSLMLIPDGWKVDRRRPFGLCSGKRRRWSRLAVQASVPALGNNYVSGYREKRHPVGLLLLQYRVAARKVVVDIVRNKACLEIPGIADGAC